MKRLWVLSKHAFFGFKDDHCTRLAAAISYYALFSIVPLTIFIVSVFGFVLRNQSVQGQVVDQILSFLPLSESNGRTSVVNALNNLKSISGPAAALSLIVTLWASSAMFGAIRTSLNTVFDADEQRPFFQGKLLDFAQVGGVGLFLILSIAFTASLRTAQSLSSEHLGPLAGDNPLWNVAVLIAPAAFSLVAFLVLYRVVPAMRPTLPEALPGALVAMVLFELLKNTFAIYVAHFNNYDVVYGSLSAILLFLLYMYLSFNIVLIGGEVSSVTAKMGRGVYADELAGIGPVQSLRTRIWRGVKGLFVRQQPVPGAPEPSPRQPASLEQHRAGARHYQRHEDDAGEEQRH